MKTPLSFPRGAVLALGLAVLAPGQHSLRAQDPASPATPADLSALLQRGLFEEEGRRRLDEATAAYEALLQAFDEQKHLAATALFRLAEVRRKQDRPDEAIALYQRLLAEFPTADPHARLSRENLAALGAPEALPTAPTTLNDGDADMGEEEAKELRRLRTLAETSPDLLSQPNIMPDSRGQPPIIVASSRGWAQVVRFLLEKGAPVDIQGPGSTTPLVAAAEAGHKAICEWLLSQGADIKKSPSALTLAAGRGYQTVVEWLLANGADVNARGKTILDRGFSTTPLVAALEEGHDAVFQRLLKEKPDVNQSTGANALTPLHAAAAKGNTVAVRQLLELGADPNATTQEDKTGSRHTSARRVVVPRLRESRPPEPEVAKGRGNTPLLLAVVARSPECVALLLAAGAEVDVPDPEGNTALFLTMQIDDPGLAENITAQLAKAGADVQVANHYQQSGVIPTLGVAFSHGPDYQGVVEVLLAHGADPEQKISSGFVCLDFATPPNYKAEWVRRVRHPKMIEEAAITFSLPQAAWSRPLAQRRSSAEAPPDLPTLLLALDDSQRTSAPLNWNQGTLCRKPSGEGELSRISLDLAQVGELPSLQWGDVIELVTEAPYPDEFSVGTSNSSGSASLASTPEIKALLKAHLTRHITIVQDGKEYPLTLRGRLLVYDPTKPEAPLLSLQGLAELLGFGAIGQIFKIIRTPEAGGGIIEAQTGFPQASQLELKDGDRVEAPSIQMMPPSSWRHDRIWVTSPGRLMAWQDEPRTTILQMPPQPLIGRNKSAPTLLQLVASLYAPVTEKHLPSSENKTISLEDLPSGEERGRLLLQSGYIHPRPVLSHPDWAGLRIRRLKDESSAEEDVIIPPLAEVLERISDASTVEEAREADIPLRGGDIIELPAKSDASKPWIGFDDNMKMLLRKALSLEMTLVEEGSFRKVAVSYVPPYFVATPQGLLPFTDEPLTGGNVSQMISSVAADSLLGGSHYIIGLKRSDHGNLAGTVSLEVANRDSLGHFLTDFYLKAGDQVEVRRISPPPPVAPESRPPAVRRREILPAPVQ